MDHSPGFLRLVEDSKTRVREISVNETRAKLEQRIAAWERDLREYAKL